MPVDVPPLLVSFSNSKQYIQALGSEIEEEYIDQIQHLIDECLPPVVSIRCLATLFGLSPSIIGALVKKPEKFYRTFNIPKGKSQRTIQAPKIALKVIQRWIGFHLAEKIQINDSVYGFVKGRSPVGAANVHCGARWIYSIDIENFFPSISLDQVISGLASIGYPPHGSEIIAKICSYNNALPQGSPSSPVLSNLVFKEADLKLNQLAKTYGLKFTRYADDIVFSGQDGFPENLKIEAKDIVERYGWVVSAKKEYFSELPKRLKVHGLLVHGERPRLTKGYRNRIRAYKHLLHSNKIKEEDVCIIKGHISYSESVKKFEKP